MSGFLAYIERNDAHEAALSAMRTAVRDARRVATVAGFGPRFLHSTGQAYKGGPAGGVFIEITRTAEPDLAIPGHRASFGTVQLAQALGDLDVLAERGADGCAFTSRETWMPDLRRSAGSSPRPWPEN